MPELASQATCLGCHACEAVCPTRSITFQGDGFFTYPLIDNDTCIQCGKCEKACSYVRGGYQKELEDVSQTFYCAYNADAEERAKATSGGTGGALAQHALEQGWLVCGAAFDEAMRVKHILSDSEAILDKIRGSKYLQSDVTGVYEQEFMNCKNENAYCTPYTLLRLLADLIPNMPDKLLYLDIDMMANGDIAELYNTDISEYEYAAVREKYGSKLIALDYINAGMLLLNMKKIKETKLLEKARELIRTKKMLFADQDAVYKSTTKKLLLPRKFNEQAWFNKKDTVICHFCKRMLWWPYPRTENYKQWNVEEVHKILKCHAFDADLNEYLEWKKDAEKVF